MGLGFRVWGLKVEEWLESGLHSPKPTCRTKEVPKGTTFLS